MADHIADYCRYLTEEKHVQKNTLNSYARDLNQFQAWLLDTGITDLKKVNRDTVSEYLHHMGDQGKSPATITRSAASIRSFYNYLTNKAHLLRENPVKDIDAPKLKKELPRYLTLEQSKDLLSAVDGKNQERDYAILDWP